MEVFAANGVIIKIQADGGYTPTPVISHAILGYNRGRKSGLADGVVITPSHNPPDDGGFKYNPPERRPGGHRSPPGIQDRANELLADGHRRRQAHAPTPEALALDHVHEHDYVTPYVADLGNVVDMDRHRRGRAAIGVDPMGGAGIDYWEPIAERYGLNLQMVNKRVDPTFGFMTVDKDGKIRMDCSSPYAMASLIGLREQFDVAFGNDPDYDRHGIVTSDAGLMNPNHYLAVAIQYLFTHRPDWPAEAAVGKTLVSSVHDRPGGGRPGPPPGRGAGGLQVVRRRPGRRLLRLRRRGERRRLLPAPRRHGVDHGQGRHHPGPAGRRDHRRDRPGGPRRALPDALDAPSSAAPGLRAPRRPGHPRAESRCSNSRPAGHGHRHELAGEPITAKLTHAPGNGAAIGGLKVVTDNGWFAARHNPRRRTMASKCGTRTAAPSPRTG